MSENSEILETALKHKNLKEIMNDEDKTAEYLNKRSADEDEPYELPKMTYHTNVKIAKMFKSQVIIFNGSTTPKHIILYLHGGAYVNQIDDIQISFCDRLAEKTDATIFAPIYPLTPNHTYEETYQLVEKLYDLILEFEKPFTILGDSAGGGLSAAFSEYLSTKKLAQPEHLILISPWVDVSMSGDYDNYRNLDPILGIDALPKVGEAWAGDLDTKNYKVSPLFGDVENLPQTTIFVGTHEAIYPDIIKFYNKLKDNGIEVKLIIGDKMTHAYPLYPSIPESKEAFNQIVEIIQD